MVKEADTQLINKANEAVAKAGVELLRKEPFYAHVLSGLSRIVTDEVPTMAVSYKNDGFCLWINPTFTIKELKEKERIAVVKHELLHLVFKHLFRSRGNDRELENIAADLVVNQYVSPWPLPNGALLLSSFPDLNLLPEQTFEWYYEKLKCLRNPNANEKYPKSKNTLNSIEEGKNARGNHDLWGVEKQNGEKSNEKIVDVAIKKILGQALQKSGTKNIGDLPLGIQRELSRFNEEPKISWKRILRIFSNSCGKTKLVATRRKESTRFPGNPGTKIKRIQHIAVAIDTSGSIDENTLQLFWTEIIGIQKTGAKITIIESDCEIQKVWELNRKATLPELKGGGGTSFDPVINWLNKNRNLGIGGCVYFTDGYAAKPILKPSCPVLWVLYGDLEDNSHLKCGKIIKIE
jgi:predicted metal-dependent peptidase